MNRERKKRREGVIATQILTKPKQPAARPISMGARINVSTTKVKMRKPT